MYDNLVQIATALKIAVESDFMAREHGAAIWKKQLSLSGLDIPKKLPEIKTVETVEKNVEKPVES